MDQHSEDHVNYTDIMQLFDSLFPVSSPETTAASSPEGREYRPFPTETGSGPVERLSASLIHTEKTK